MARHMILCLTLALPAPALASPSVKWRFHRTDPVLGSSGAARVQGAWAARLRALALRPVRGAGPLVLDLTAVPATTSLRLRWACGHRTGSDVWWPARRDPRARAEALAASLVDTLRRGGCLVSADPGRAQLTLDPARYVVTATSAAEAVPPPTVGLIVGARARSAGAWDPALALRFDAAWTRHWGTLLRLEGRTHHGPRVQTVDLGLAGGISRRFTPAPDWDVLPAIAVGAGLHSFVVDQAPRRYAVDLAVVAPVRVAWWPADSYGLALALVPGVTHRARRHERDKETLWRQSAFSLGLGVGLLHRIQPSRPRAEGTPFRDPWGEP